MIEHTVLLRLNRPVAETALAALRLALERFAAEAPGALEPGRVLWDLGLRGEGPSVSEASLRVRFSDAEAFSAYLAHPKHRQFVAETLVPHCESWLSTQITEEAL